MAKQTQTPTIEKDGFVLYRDMVSIANEALPDYHDKGKLFALITQFVNQQPLEDAPERVEMAFKFLKNGIEKNSAKYARKKAAMQAYYEERNKEKSEKEDKSAKSKRAAKNTINNSISTSYSDSDSNSDSNSDSDSDSNSHSHSKQGIINDTIKENINNSFSDNKYTLDEVRSILERERIFFKNNWLKEFYLLNNTTYKWKFDPTSAALAFIRLHPEATKGEKKENFPPSSAAPPEGAAGLAYSQMQAEAYRAACELWDTIYKEIRPKIRDEDSKFLLTNIRPDIAWRQGYAIKCLRFIVKNGDGKPTFAELVKTADGILVPHRETFTKYGVKIYYRPEKAEGTKKDVNG